MPRPREQQISLADTPYYHIVSRCVRRTFLCGFDHETGQSYEHRRHWIEQRIRLLSSIFTIDLCAYAVMSNHYHLVVKLCPEQADDWNDDQVLERWASLFKGPPLVQRYQAGEDLHEAERRSVKQIIDVYRQRLTDLSWFMKCLNESIAREANREDDCTGHFWESRFKSQALLTEQAVLSCMTYVDLNPVRAAMAETPETSDYTSIKERLSPRFDLAEAIQSQSEQLFLKQFPLPLKPLLNFEGAIRNESQMGILFSLSDYLELVDFTGRIIHPNKRGHIPEHQPPILKRLELSTEEWLAEATEFEDRYHDNRRAHLDRRRSAA
ncbi:transposase [Marinobacter zhanjiangensis]|uniref:Transposase n=1 Tax=Marinobacter zhanjiangensis TaxID=578215 RepID=A0ABQ3B711_9GAMM|nr:transposase [Marinobacter zhanjiangensis]GGY81498.1 transposase [Marinobacter zhanjiangensis]